MKSIATIIKPNAQHWVGNGFYVRTLFSYHNYGRELSPFLLLDYAAPKQFPADGTKRGVEKHPHRGFETVTIVYQGELEHQDTAGNKGVIKKGEVQWMTAGAGIVHEEFHSQKFSQAGGEMQMVQLWINLPKKDKKVPPNYQSILKEDIPIIQLPKNAGFLRLIAGDYQGKKGPGKSYTPMHIWDLQLNAEGVCQFEVPESWSAAIIVLEGQIKLNHSEKINCAEVALLSHEKTTIELLALKNSTILVLSGEPINEPIVGHGPFVLNEKAEILQAIEDYQNGQF